MLELQVVPLRLSGSVGLVVQLLLVYGLRCCSGSSILHFASSLCCSVDLFSSLLHVSSASLSAVYSTTTVQPRSAMSYWDGILCFFFMGQVAVLMAEVLKAVSTSNKVLPILSSFTLYCYMSLWLRNLSTCTWLHPFCHKNLWKTSFSVPSLCPTKNHHC